MAYVGQGPWQEFSNPPTKDSFTGDGSTTTFNLGTSGATTNSAFIFYNGIALKPTSDYSISGVTLTLTFAPVALSEIMARYQI